jgi:hypothetical protein
VTSVGAPMPSKRSEGRPRFIMRIAFKIEPLSLQPAALCA